MIQYLFKTLMGMGNVDRKNHINSIMGNEDELSKKYVSFIKKFVDFMYDNVDGTNESIDYADRFDKITQLVGKDRMNVLLNITEAKSESIDVLRNIMDDTNKTDAPVRVFLRFYVNRISQIDKDVEMLGSKEIKEMIDTTYRRVFGDKELSTPINELTEICKLLIDENII